MKNISRIVFGEWLVETWYFSPIPKELHFADVLYFCEFDLSFFGRPEQLDRYLKTKCKAFHPPGDEIYRDGSISVFEVDPKHQRIYCENSVN